jgi:hypothetical protein
MNTENSKQLIEKTLSSLPDYVQESIKSVPWTDGLQRVTQKEHLHIDKMEAVQTETLLMVLGLIDDIEYIGKIHDILGVSGEKLDSFIEDVNKEVFMPLREDVVRRKNGVENETDKDKDDLEHKTTLHAFEKRLNQKVHTKSKATNHSIQRSEKKSYVDPYREPVD